MKWFKHDSDAHTDAKLKKVKMKYGLAGYGLYWHCLELICSGIDKTHLTFELEHDAEIISFDTGIHVDLVSEMMTYMVNLGLFENTDGRITCLKMAKRLDQSMTSNTNMRTLIDQVRHNHDGVMTESCKSRVDKIRKEEIRKEESKSIGETKKRSTVPYQKILDLYHEILPNNPQIIKLNDNRKRQIKARHVNNVQSLDDWREYFTIVSESKFLTGQQPPGFGRSKPFIASLDFLIKEINLLKIIEGNYHE